MGFTSTTMENLQKMNSPECNIKKWENKTELGKLRSVANSLKNLDHSEKFIEIIKCGCDNPKECVVCKNMKEVFIETLKDSGNQDFERFGIKRVIARLEAELSKETDLNRISIDKIRLLKQCYQSLHEMQYGKKFQTDIIKKEIGFEDIMDVYNKRKEEENYGERNNVW